MEINVTQEDIDKGIPVSASFCPIALACERTFENHCTVTMGGGVKIYYSHDKFIKHYKDIPQSVKQFIKDFDHKLPVAPFTFELKE